MTNIDNKKKLFDALSEDYDMGTFEVFANDVNDDVKRRKLYDAISNEYDLGDFETFSAQLLGITPAPQNTFTSEQLGLQEESNDGMITTERQVSTSTPMLGTLSAGENRREPVKDLGSASSGQGGISEYIEMLSGVKSEGQKKAEEQMRIAKERAASGERNWHPYGDTKKPLIESPDIRIGAADNVGLGSPYFNADIYADEAVRRAEEGLKPADAWTEATKRAQANIANKNRQAQIKKAAEDAVGELRIKSNELSRRYEEADAKRPKIAIGNPTTFGGVLTEQGYYDRDYRNLNAANNILKKTEDMMADFASKQENGRLYNLGRGLVTSTFNPDNWDFGFGDANVAERLLSVVEKADKDEPLSESEQLLLDAAINQQVMQGYYSELSGWQKAGKMFGESLPFMAQIAVNPLGSMSKYAGSKAAKAVLKHISKKVSKKAIERILARTAGLTAQTLGDLGTSYGIALTSNLGNTTADALNRQIGDIQYDFDDNGIVRYNGRLNVKEAGEAWLDAVNSQAFEFYSEQMGNYFAPILKGMGKLGGKALKNFGMDGVNRWVSDFAKKGSVRQLNQFFEKTQFHGFASEYAEEIANGMLNAAFVGDMTMEDVFSKDNLVDTAIGLSVMGAIGPMVSTAGYARAKYKEKQALNEADDNGRRLMGHAWDSFADAVRRSKNGKELSANLRETLNSFGRKALPGEDMRQILSYAQAYNRYKAVEEVSAAAVAEGVMDERDLELQRQYENGQTTTDKHGLRVTYEAAADAVEGIIPLNIGENTAYDIADKYDEQGDTDTATAIRVFLSARAAHSGMTAQIREQAQSELESANAEIDSHTNKTDGNIYSVTLGGGLNGYVTNGTVITDSDGDIDIDATRDANKSGYVYVNVDGVIEPTSVDKFVSLDGVESAADAKAAREAEINAALNAQYEELTAPAETAAAPVNNTPIVSNEVAENAARALGVLPEELEEVILDEQEGLERAARYNNIGDTDSADAIRAYVAERFGTPAVQPAQVNNATAAEVGNNGGENILENGNNGAENIPAEQAPENVAPIPVEKRGKEERQAFHLVPVERTTEELYNSGLDQQEIDAFVQANIDEINSDIEKYSKKQPKMGANIAAYKAAKEEWQAQNEDLAARLNYYKGLQEHIKGITTSNTAEAINDPIADVSDITTPEEFIAATRESETVGRGGEVLQDEQLTNASGTKPVGTGQQGGAATSSVQSNGANVATPGNQEVSEPVGNSEQLNQSGDNTEMGTNEASNENILGRSLSEQEAQSLIAEMENNAEVAPEIDLTIDNWDALFGEDGTVNTPIGEVKMGENQFTKLMRQDRNGKLGMIKPTLENPDAIIEDKSKAKEGDTIERASSYVFVKAFKKADGTRYYYFTSVTVSKDNKEVVISNQEKRRNAIANLLVNGKLVWKHADNVSSASDVANGLYSSQVDSSELATEGTDAPQTNGTISTDVPSSEGESTTQSANSQENSVKSGENTQNEGEISQGIEDNSTTGGESGSSEIPNNSTISQESEQVSEQVSDQVSETETKSEEESVKRIREYKEQLSAYPNRDIKKYIKQIEEALPILANNVVRVSDDKTEEAYAKLREWQEKLAAAKELIQERDNGSWKTDFGVKLSYNKDITIEDVKTLFENLNGDKAVGELFNKVYAVAKTLGLKIKISDQLSAATGNAGNDGIVKYGAALFYRADIDNQKKAETLLHELIHTCTMYATTLHKNRAAGGVISKMYEALPVEIKEACKELERIYSLVKDNDVLKGQYGINSVDEMVAELSNSDFRGKLKEIGLWERIVNAIKKLFDFPIKTDNQRASDALTEAERVLEAMLDNFDKATYDEVRNRIQASGRGRKRSIAPKAELQRGSLSLESENPAFAAATEKTMQALEKTGVEVAMATEEQVKAMMGTMHSVDVTPEMRESVMQGQPMFLRTANGTVYGWTVNGKIYLTPDGINPNTPVHEYTHLWASAIEQNDPKLWSKIVEAMKQSLVWNEVMADEAYRDIWNDENRVASEVLSRLSGNENYRRTMQEAAERENDPTKKFGLIAAWGRVKRALADFWNWVKKNTFGVNDNTPWQEFVNSAIGDFYKGVNPNVQSSPIEGMFIGEKGATNLDKAEEATIRLDNLAIAREMEAAEKDAKSIKMATGWERGADGKWRYETEDVRVNKEAKLFSLEDYESFSITKSIEDGRVNANSTVKLSKLVNDKELFSAYPEMNEYFVSFEKMAAETKGSHNFVDRVIRINKDDIGSLDSTLAHEIQHAIQSIEGFAKGGNSSTVAPMVQTFRTEVAPLHNAMLDTPEWAEKKRLQNRWLDEWDKTAPDETYMAQLQERIDEINNSGVLKEIEQKQAELIKKYGYNKTVVDIISEPYSEDAEIWNNLPEDFYDRYEAYHRLAGEVESRNVQKRMNMTAEERRASLAEKTEDVAREDQTFLYDNLGESAMMGSRVDARMAEVAAHFEGKQLTTEQRAVVDVFGGKSDNLTISVKTKDRKDRKIEMRQGNDLAGARHSLYVHYGTTKGVITADDIVLIPEVLANGERTVNGKKAVYKLDINGTKYTVVTYVKQNKEEFHNFYSNKKGQSSQSVNAEIGDTQSARITEELASDDKGSDNSSNSQENEDILFLSVGGNGGYDFRPKRGESTEQREERMNNYTNEIIAILKERGFDVTNSRSRTSFGMSNYVNVYSPEGRFLEKIRISDHSVLRNSRVLDEYNPLPTQSPADVVADLFGNNTGDMYREGEGAYSDEEINFANDPVSKVLGKPRGTKKKQREFAARQRQRMAERVESLAKKLHLDNVEIVTDASALEGKKQSAKGFYSKSTGKITVVIPNHASVLDVEQTLLHEAVAHYGLRQLFGEHFDTFLDNVLKNADVSIRKRILELAQKKNWDLRTATEEYLASLAEETNFENTSASWWRQIKELFLNMLHKIGFEDFGGVTLTDNELRYILWRSYENLAEPGKFRSILGEVSDIAKQYELKVGNYAQNSTDASTAAENDDLFRDGDSYSDAVSNEKESALSKIEAARKKRLDDIRQFGTSIEKMLDLMRTQKEYDRTTVETLVKLANNILDMGLVSELSRYEIKRLLAPIVRGVGQKNLTRRINEIVNALLDAQLAACEHLLDKQLKTKGSKITNKGVEAQGSLDAQGQQVLTAFKEGRLLDKKSLTQRLTDALNRMGDDSSNVASVAAAEYQGLLLAQKYREDITDSVTEGRELHVEIIDARESKAAGRMSAKAFSEFKLATEEAILKNKMERVDAYLSFLGMLSGTMKGSVDRAKEFRKEEVERVREIQHNANSDMEGRTAAHTSNPKMEWFYNNPIVRFFMNPLATFDYMLRRFGDKSVKGEGYLWNRFMGGYIKANDEAWKGLYSSLQELDAKVSEVFGKKMKWADLFYKARYMPKALVTMWNGEKMEEFTITQGNMLYIYMVNKMEDGQMKLRKMGITESVVDELTKKIDPRLKDIADWVQDTFLKSKRNKYNEVYERMFGAPMAAIENYFPLVINSRSRGQEVDISEPDREETTPSTITGSIIKRRRNSLPLDILNADAFDVVTEHLRKMEHWAAFAEYSRDLNALLSYNRFKNQVLNMSTLRFGAGTELWRNFQKVASISAGAYTPAGGKSSFDKAAVNISKGVTAAKISFRIFTAFMQLLSAPAYLASADWRELVKSFFSMKESWNWAIKELPGFAERWQSRMAGNEKLKSSDVDWDVWKNKYLQNLQKYGMATNAAIDAATVAFGANAIYNTALKRYKDAGFSEEEAKKKALNEASVLFNETQQSSEGAYMSPMQMDRTLAANALTIYRNASMGYQRKLMQSVYELKRMAAKGYKKESVEFMAKQYEREGLTKEQARIFAEEEYKNSLVRNLANVAVFGFILQFAWNLGAYLPYLIFGDDDDKKADMKEDAAVLALCGGWVEGLSGGNIISGALFSATEGDLSKFTTTTLPIISELEQIVKSKDPVKALEMAVNLLVQSGIGTNPQTLSDAIVAIIDFAKAEDKNFEEATILFLRTINAPQSSINQLLLDRVEDVGTEIKEGARFAEYQMKRNYPFTNWLQTDEGYQERRGKYLKRFDELYKERVGIGTENIEDVNALIDAENSTREKDLLFKEQKKILEKDKPNKEDFKKIDAVEQMTEMLNLGNINYENYIKQSTAADGETDYQVKLIESKLKKKYDKFKELEGDAKLEYYNKNGKDLDLYLDSIRPRINSISKSKKNMELNPNNAEEWMQTIRETRQEIINIYGNE